MAINSSIRHEDRPRSGLALGGLGTGSFTLHKDGVFRDWTICNNLPQFPAPRLDEREFDEASRLFFIVRWQEKGRQPRLKLLQIEPASQKQVAAIVPMTYIYPWMTGVDRIEGEASFPFTRLCNDEGGAKGTKDEGCLVDQLIGQWALGQAGLGSLLDRRRVRTAMRSILRLNSTEWGLRNCVWPGGPWLYDFPPDVWVDQANTAWTGVELTFAALLIREGLVREGLAVARHVDRRYRRSGLYFDHQECGGHYLRPMVAWDLINALLGLTICCGRYEFVPPTKGADLKALFAFPGGWAHYRRTRKAGEQVVAIQVRSGRWECSQLALGLEGLTGKKLSIRLAGRALPAGACSTTIEDGKLVIHFATPLTVPEGKVLSVTVRS